MIEFGIVVMVFGYILNCRNIINKGILLGDVPLWELCLIIIMMVLLN